MSNEWRLASLSRLPLSELRRLRDECKAERRAAVRTLIATSRAEIIKALEAERVEYWKEVSRSPEEAAQTNAARPAAAAPKAKSGPHTITAEECNEFLRSLPPVPLYGEGRS